MGLPSKLKNMNLFVNGASYFGKAAEVTPAKLARKMEDWRGGGMDTAIKVDMGGEMIEMEFTMGGLEPKLDKGFGATTHDAHQFRYVGAFQDDNTGKVRACEIVCRGRYEEIDRGSAKPGDDTEIKYKVACSYYKEVVDNEIIVEIDAVNAVFRVGGVDRLAEIRNAIGIGGGGFDVSLDIGGIVSV
jgi:P2 family phage contractile tail tube protein|tara:strand:- start:6108 stop:6668 length:561 start_codon:yes stop_codon:yes gene_type:complete